MTEILKKDLKLLRENLLGKRAERNILNNEINHKKTTIELKNSIVEKNDKILVLYRNSSLYAKEKIRNNIESLTSNALDVIYGGSNKFKIDIVEKRSRHEAEFYLDDGFVNTRIKKPFLNKGGGVVTMIALALQLSIIETAGIDGIICLDEISKMVDAVAINNLAEFLLEYTDHFNKQIVLITHQDQLESAGSLIYNVTKEDGISRCEEVI
jgi:DNA repair exonuclease SbcCD ATPase subunit